MAVLSARYWPKRHDPAREGALVMVLTTNAQGSMVTGYGHQTWWAAHDELEVLVETEGD